MVPPNYAIRILFTIIPFFVSVLSCMLVTLEVCFVLVFFIPGPFVALCSGKSFYEELTYLKRYWSTVKLTYRKLMSSYRDFIHTKHFLRHIEMPEPLVASLFA
jgi:hypothetical protein